MMREESVVISAAASTRYGSLKTSEHSSSSAAATPPALSHRWSGPSTARERLAGALADAHEGAEAAPVEVQQARLDDVEAEVDAVECVGAQRLAVGRHQHHERGLAGLVVQRHGRHAVHGSGHGQRVARARAGRHGGGEVTPADEAVVAQHLEGGVLHALDELAAAVEAVDVAQRAQPGLGRRWCAPAPRRRGRSARRGR